MGCNCYKMITDQRDADNWQNTIVSFEPEHRLRDLCISEPDQPNTQEVAVQQQKFKIRLATNEDRRDSASLLIEKMYSWRGYATGATSNEEPNRITLVASANEHILATLTLGYDSPMGLMVDDMYKTEVDSLRNAGRVVCELTKLAVDQNVRSKDVLASLFHIAYIYGKKIHNGTDFVIEVNPRHALFYRKMLGFEDFGEEKTCPRVNAPAILLRLDLDHATRKIAELGGKKNLAKGEKSYYPYFFTPEDELGITKRLRRELP